MKVNEAFRAPSAQQKNSNLDYSPATTRVHGKATTF